MDDKDDSRYLLKTLLIGHGHQVEEAMNGADALETLHGGFDLIISDILMPVMDGIELCRRVRIEDSLRQIPFIFYTATYTGPEDEEFAMKAGADCFVRKPCEPDAFLDVVRKVTANPPRSRTAAEGLDYEKEVLVLYSKRLVRKLEQTMLEARREAEVRKETEEALSISNTRLLLALRSSSIGLWEWNLETNEVWFSPEWKSMLGYEEHEISDRYEEWESRLHPEDRSRILVEVEAYIKGERPEYNVEFRLRHNDGSYVWIRARGEIIAGSGGKPRIFTGCHVDITEYKVTAIALDIESRKFQTIVDQSPLALYLVDRDSRSLHINPRFIEMFGYDLESIPAKRDWLEKAYPDPAYRREVVYSWKKELEKAESRIIRSRNIKVRCNDESFKIVNVHATFLANGDQLFAYEDVTEQVRLEDELRQAQKMSVIASIAEGISHDFNNILTALMGHAELAKMHLPADTSAISNINEILAAANRAKDLIKNILAFSRQNEKKLVPVSLYLVVKEALSLLRSILPKTIEIRVDLAPTAMVLGDPTQIHQVIMNLCTNAYHAMRDKGGDLGNRS